LTDAQGRNVVQRDSEPGSSLRPTIGWTSNEIVQDDEGFIVPPGTTPGTYHLVVVVYNSASVRNLSTPSGALYSLVDVTVASQ
jgi:hypothetical protein